MTSGDYVKFLKLFGKLCKTYDVARADQAVHETLMGNSDDQFGSGGSANLPEIDVFNRTFQQWRNTQRSGVVAEQALMLSIATQLLALDDFYTALTTKPATRAPEIVLAAWVTDMGLDSKTLLTLTTSGLVRFFNIVAGHDGLANTLTIPTAGSPTYADATYVVSTVV